ncbi:hypothetical protein SLS62_003991 [Diatrype stigma]|uniref:Uncharacterized protein n=1 Tax=Diatrype stigma TaxID=117547 RepID=A0AAN9YU85_9PEZI
MLTSRLVVFFLAASLLLFVLLVSRDYYYASIDGNNNIVVIELPPLPKPVIQKPQDTQQQQYRTDVELVVASTKQEDTSWIVRYLPEWRAHRYVVDDDDASSSAASTLSLKVPANKGHEAMVYLTHIIDAYETLPPRLVFVHASRFAWHNDDPDYDAVPALRRLRLPHLREAGYANLRCAWVIGCPAEIRPAEDAGVPSAKGVYKQAWDELMFFGAGVPAPDVVAVGCCSQFGVTRETVRRRPVEDYVRFREWLLATPLDDSLSGRVFEFSWHIIFGKEAVHCPSAKECYCETFGICDAVCDDGACDGRYTLPPYSTLPEGWPRVGWEQEERNFTGPLD